MRLRPWFALLLGLQLVPALAQEAAPAQAPVAEVAPSDDPDATETAATKVPLEEIRRFVGVFDAVREAYVDPVTDRKLMQSAIKGLLLDLDPQLGRHFRGARRRPGRLD